MGYVGVTVHELRRDVLSGLAYVVLVALLAIGFTEVVVQTGLAKPLEGFLAFAPGGQAEMTVLAIVSGADLGFVIAQSPNPHRAGHHRRTFGGALVEI